MFTTDANRIRVRSMNDVTFAAGGYISTGLLVDGVPQGDGAAFTSTTSDHPIETEYVISGGGTHTIELIDGPTSYVAVGTGPVRQTVNLGYLLPHGASHSVVNPTVPEKRVAIMGDSISLGAFSDAAPNQAGVFQAWSILMRKNMLGSVSGALAGARLVHAGYSAQRWEDEDADSTAITASMAHLSVQLDGSSSNTVISNLGTNDWGSGIAHATMQTHLGNWADQFHTDFPSAKWVLISPTTRNGEATPNAGGSTMSQYRTAMSTVCSARSSYCHYVDGSTLVTYPTNMAPDLLHLKTAGMVEGESNIRSAMVAASLGY